MGFFTPNEHSNLYKSYEFPVVEGYDGTIGCGLALIEGYQNDLALFSAAVTSDIAEIAMIQENAGSDVYALQEASVSGMVDAIKKFFIKLGAKIKAIFTGFMAKLESYFTKDLKAYVKKYERSLDKKDYKDMKIKYMEVKNNRYTVEEAYRPSKYSITISGSFLGNEDDIDKRYEDTERSDLIKEAYHSIINDKVDDNKDFDDWYHEELFNDEEVKDNWDYSKIKAIAARLTANTKTISEIKTFYEKVNGDIKKIIKDIDVYDKKVTSKYKDNSSGTTKDLDDNQTFGVRRADDNRRSSGERIEPYGLKNNIGKDISLKVATKQVSLMRQKASAYQDVVLHISQVVMKEAKIAIAQDKKVFAAAVAYKTMTKESTLLDMISECAYDETIEDLDRVVA